ncbi:MAG: IS66 family transposase [bacterium]
MTKHEEKSKYELIRDMYEIHKENQRLKKKLRKYENPHTPPSKDERKSRTNFVSKTGLPVGKKTGYKGRTREKKKPTHFINLFQGICSKCGKHNKPKEIREKTYEETPELQPIKVVKTKWGYYECGCGHCWESKPEEVPEKGLFGKNAQTHIVLLKFDDRLPLRKTVSALERQFGLILTSKAIYDITKRVADKVTPEYIKIRRKIRRAKYLHIDETKIKIQGVWYYVWIFRSRKYIFFCIRKERNRNVLDEILGYYYNGWIICDGLSAYKEYTKYLQRCWAHILRETKEMAEKYDDAKPMHNWMRDLFKVVKSVSIKDPLKKRKKLYDKCVQEMRWLVGIYSSYRHLSKVITKIGNGLNFWFTRILHPQIEPTNNNAEQPLREIKVIQKIIGTLRNEDGASIMEKIMTFLATWRMQGKNNFTELRSLL